MRVVIIYPQVESKCAQASGAQKSAASRDSRRTTTCRVPYLHCGQDRLPPVTTGAGVKLAPSVLASGEIAYLRGEGPKIEVAYSGKRGPSGTDLSPNLPTWSPDSMHVAYRRRRRSIPFA
jgi:hypothetical protein